MNGHKSKSPVVLVHVPCVFYYFLYKENVVYIYIYIYDIIVRLLVIIKNEKSKSHVSIAVDVLK